VERKRSFFTRTRILAAALGVLVVIGLIVVVTAIGGGDDEQKADPKDPFPENKNFHMGANAKPFAGAAPMDVQFEITPFHNDGAVRYFWRFDDGTTSREQNPRHTFKEAGYYTVIVDATDSARQRDRHTLILGAWPDKLWNSSQRRRLTSVEARNAIRDQSRRTQKRKERLREAGKAALISP
jgi:hypothetical protein